MTNHWDAIRRHWQLLGSPLCPPPEAVAAYERELGLQTADAVLLGVTPELAGLGRTMLAIDESPAMISGIWPGDTVKRRAVVGNWLDMPVAAASVDAVIGDGCLSALGLSAARRALFAAIARVLGPNGRAGLRLYANRETPDEPSTLRALALSGGVSTFHALKWLVAMTATGSAPDHAIPVQTILERFDELFPDRDELSTRTGWELPVIGTIDVYRNSPAIYSFAPVATLVGEAEAFFGNVRIVATGAYGLAERCPLLVLRSPRQQ